MCKNFFAEILLLENVIDSISRENLFAKDTQNGHTSYREHLFGCKSVFVQENYLVDISWLWLTYAGNTQKWER